MNAILSLIISSGAVFTLVAIAFFGVWAAPHAFGVPRAAFEWLFGVVIPYFAVIIFFVGVVYKMVQWGKRPVPFRITSTCAQQKSLPSTQGSALRPWSSGLLWPRLTPHGTSQRFSAAVAQYGMP